MSPLRSPDVAAVALGLAWGLALPTPLGAALALVGAALGGATLRGEPVADVGRGLLVGLVWFGLADRWVGDALSTYGVGGARRAEAALALAHAATLAPWWLGASLLVRRGVDRGAALALAGVAWTEPMLALQPVPAAPALMLAGAPWTLGSAALGGASAGTGALLGLGAGLGALLRTTWGGRWPGASGASAGSPPGTAGRTEGSTPGDPSRAAGWDDPLVAADDRARVARAAVAWLVAFVCLTALGLARAWSGDGAAMTLGVVQPDTGAFDGRRTSTEDERRERLLRLIAQVATADVVVTPEAAWPGAWRPRHASRVPDAHVLLGAWTGAQQVMVEVEGGVERGRYAKVLPAPASERRVGPWGEDAVTPGDGPAVLAGLGPLLCFEDASPGALRAALAAGPDALLLSANDAWSDARGAAWHRAQATLVALSAGRWVARVSTSGPSAVVRPDGVAVWEAPWRDGDAAASSGEAAIVEVRRRSGGSGAAASPWLGAAAALGALSLLSRRAS